MRPWPPVYDEIALAETITRVATAVADRLTKRFYHTSFDDPEPCQGDILKLPAGIPVIDEEKLLALITGR